MRYLTAMRTFLGLALALSLLACSKTEVVADSPPSTASAARGEASTKVAASGPSKAALGQRAPSFTLPSLSGETVSLSQHAGKTVVLEWFNPDCPFVRQSHTEGSLKGLAKKYQGEVVWLAINSNAAGKQGHGREANEAGKQRYGIDYPILFDHDGQVGRQYGAQRTPHMYVIDPQGTLVYAGAIDNSGGGDLEDTPEVVNYVMDAIAATKAKQPPKVAETEAWGCTVKYAN